MGNASSKRKEPIILLCLEKRQLESMQEFLYGESGYNGTSHMRVPLSKKQIKKLRRKHGKSTNKIEMEFTLHEKIFYVDITGDKGQITSYIAWNTSV